MRSHARALFAVTALFMIFAASPAQASKTVTSFFGNTGSTPSGNALDGGLFNTPRGVAVNVAGTGGATAGDIYVVNGSGNRIDQFSASGAFIRAFGRDVIEEGKANDNASGFEICDTTAGNAAADCKAGITSPAEGGTLSSAQGIAINQATGHLYVSNQSLIRVDEFDATGHFVRAFGQDVVSSGPGNVTPTSAKQTLTVDATEGQFKLSFRGQSTADIAFNATATEVQAALQALTTVGASNATVTGGPGGAGGGTPYVITFAGTLANAPMPVIGTSAGTTPLGGGAGASVANTTTGATAYEICNAPADTCKAGTTGSVAGAFKSTFSGQLAVAPVGAPNAGNVIVADPANLRVNEYTSTGVPVRSFGFDVSASPPALTTFETCDASNFDVCKIGTTGSGVGQFATNAVTRVAVDTTGAIYTVEPTVNFRVQKFTPQAGPPTLAPSAFAAGVLTGTSSSGTATQNNPTDIAIGASNHVFVVKVFPAGTGTPAASSQERRVLELDSTGALVDTHNSTAGINLVNGLAANALNGRLYLTSQVTPHRVYVLADAATPTATIAASDGLGDTEATLHGAVNPGGVLGTYHFEYVDDAQFQVDGWASAQVSPEIDAGNGNSPTNVSRALTGLAPSTLYHVRLVIKQTFGPVVVASSATTGDFTTGAAKPYVAPFADADADTTTATLSSRVTANGQASTYHFDWGTTAAYGNSTASKAAGSGIASIFASDEISGLQPNTTYHFRVVASNGGGTTLGTDNTFTTEEQTPAECPNQQFRQGAGAQLPECRAYEQVSPVDKNGHELYVTESSFLPVATDGNAAFFQVFGALAGDPNGSGPALANSYVASRANGTWTTRPAMPRSLPTTDQRVVAGATDDLRKSLLMSSGTFVPDPLPAAGRNWYTYDNSTGTASLFATTTLNDVGRVAASKDLETIGFTARDDLTADVGPPSLEPRAYVASGGTVQLVSRQPGTDAPFTTPSGIAGIDTSAGSPLSGANPISEDGTYVFFAAPVGSTNAGSGDSAKVYRRNSGATTEMVSPSDRTPPDPLGERAKVFRSATPDGNRVFFTSSELLTDDANTGPAREGTDLYRYDIADDELVDISATLGGDGAEVKGIAGFSDDGNRVYYVADGQVVPGEGTSGSPNLYLWEDDGTARGHTRFIATFGSGSNEDRNWMFGQERTSRVTPDGRALLVMSSQGLTAFPTNGTAQVFRYGADEEAGAGSLACVSCGTGAGPSTAPSAIRESRGIRPTGWSRNLSADGQRVFFDTLQPLLPGDTNEKVDAYVWHDGELNLLSTGTSSRDSYFFNASVDGDEAFFLTSQSLLPQDIDRSTDLYTATVGGGLAAQRLGPPVECVGDGCQGAATAAPQRAAPLSESLAGQGNVTSKPKARRCAKGKQRRKGRCVRRHAKKRGHHSNGRRAQGESK